MAESGRVTGVATVRASSDSPHRVFTFGVFEVDTTTHELRRQGKRARLQEQPFQVLEVLLERAGHVVTREELQRRLWPGKVHGDFEHGLNNAIARLREVLGDDAAAPHFIETLPRRGYRFIYPLPRTGSENTDSRNPEAPATSEPVLPTPDPVPGKRSVYLLGDFRLDDTRYLLYRAEATEPLDVKPKVVEALTYLVLHRGELLEKDRLMAALWPGLVVEENSLAQVISALRRTLGETPGENRYIVTVPGRGYRFVGDVVRLADTIESQPDGSDARTVQGLASSSHARRLITVGALTAPLVVLFVYLWYAGQEDTRAPPGVSVTSPAVTAPSPHTVAVLPFENLTADGNNDYLASGLAESVLHRLAAIPGLTAIARTSSFGYRDATGDVRAIGAALSVRYLVQGSVRTADRRLRVSAQLIDVTTGAHVWSLQFDRTIDDIFAVEDEIAANVAVALEVSLKEREHPYARFGTEAYLAFLEGGSLINTRKIVDAERAVEVFSKAVALAPEFAAAYVALADAHRHLGYLRSHGPGRSPLGPRIPGRWGEPLAAGARAAEPLLARAMELDDSIGEAYVLRADLKVIRQDWAGAEVDYRRGLELSPGYGTGHEHFAEFLERQGRLEEARTELDMAMRLNPLNPWNPYYKGFMYLFSEETGKIGEEAERYFLEALRLAPNFHPALMRLGVIRWNRGEFAEAVMLGERALALDPQAGWMRWFLVEFYLELGEVDAARAVLLDAPATAPPIQWLAICLYQGRVDRAASLLRAAPTSRHFLDQDIEAYVFRDAALATGDLAEMGDVPLSAGDIFSMVAVAHLSATLGDRDKAATLARAVLDYQDEWARSSPAYRLTYPKAAAHALLGEPDAALALLQAGAARGFHKRWWYAFERDPAFAPVRADPRFRALAERARAHAAEQRRLLQQMRRGGDVPARTRQGSAPTTC